MLADLADFARQLQDTSYDTCVVGSGAAGITLALELADHGHRVVVLEAGSLHPSPTSQRHFLGEIIGRPTGLTQSRVRAVGGSMNRWTGRCTQFDDMDFAERSWILCSGWPFDYSELEPYYERARKYLNLSASPRPESYPPIARDPALFDQSFSHAVWSYPAKPGDLNWGQRYRSRLATHPNIHLCYNAPVTGLDLGADAKSIRQVRTKLDGADISVRADQYVLCAGGIENARLLLASPLGQSGGPANRYDQVGRHFMQHPRGVAALIHTSPDQRTRLSPFLRRPRIDGSMMEFGFKLTAHAQSRLAVPNISAIITEAHGLAATLKALAHSTLAVNRKSIQSALHTMGKRLARERPLLLITDAEQTPNPSSRITLAERRDSLGLPVVRVDWRVDDDVRCAMKTFARLMAERFRAADLGEVVPSPWLYGQAASPDLTGSKHHIGATRMSVRPDKGVVDADCRVHGIDNLFVAGASTFPTGGHANPTWTIVALAIRLADHLTAAKHQSNL